LSCSLRLRSNVLDLDGSTLSIARCLGLGLGDRGVLVAETTDNWNLTGFRWLSDWCTASESWYVVLIFGMHARVNNIGRCGCGACYETDNVGVLAQPAVTSNLKQIGTLSRVGDQDPAQEVASMRRDILGEGQGRRDNVLVQQVDVITFRVGRIVIEGQVSCKHGILV
jgi:hypothetical protein